METNEGCAMKEQEALERLLAGALPSTRIVSHEPPFGCLTRHSKASEEGRAPLTLSRNWQAKFMTRSAACSESASRLARGGVPLIGSGEPGWLPAELPPDWLGDGSVRRIDDGGRKGCSEMSFTSRNRNLK